MKTAVKTKRTVGRSGSPTTRSAVLIAVIAGAILALPSSRGFAIDAQSIRVTRTVKVNDVGDGEVQMSFKMPAGLYTGLKAAEPNTAAIMRRLWWGENWSVLDGVKGRYDDANRSLVLEYHERGFARSIGDGRWSVRAELGAGIDLTTDIEKNLRLVAQSEWVATFSGISRTPWGLASVVSRVEFPEDCRNLKFHRKRSRLEYQLPEQPLSGSRADASFSWSVKSHIMSSLAKSYGNPRFAHFWVARSSFKNRGDQSMSNYRTRFRVKGYSDWSSWKRSRRVLPGQTVVDPFFPLLDYKKLAAMNNASMTVVEVEYEYVLPDGERVERSEDRRIRLLSRNQVVFSSLSSEEQANYQDMFNYGPMILGSFVTSNDPVVQQLAGIVSKKAGGVEFSKNNENTYRFMKALFDYLSESEIAYQTPPGGNFEKQFGQHIKFSRDVLRNRAGTCIDLAILYASVCEAVGLEPVMFLIPKHCFPGVLLPEGGMMGVEATAIGRMDFDKARQIGTENAWKTKNSRIGYVVNVQRLHDLGVDSIDLPPVAPDYLARLGYGPSSGKRATTVATAATTATAGNERTRYTVVRITNQRKSSVLYQLSWGNGNWESFTIKAGQVFWNSTKLSGSNSSTVPKLRIRFDYDVAEGLQMWEYNLESTLIDQDPEPLEDGMAAELGLKSYDFKDDPNRANWIELFSSDASPVSAETDEATTAHTTVGDERTRYAVVRIKNPMNIPVGYQVRWGSGKWKTCQVKANRFFLNWYKLPRVTGANAPKLRIRFDYNLAEGKQMWLYGLEPTIIGQDPNSLLVGEKAEESGIRTYAFKYDPNHANCIDLLFQKQK